MDNDTLGQEVERRLSKGIPAELGATWFEGLSMKNHYTLIARLGLSESVVAASLSQADSAGNIKHTLKNSCSSIGIRTSIFNFLISP